MIYLVEDDESIRKLITYALESQGFSACGFENAETFWTSMEEEDPELVILDIMLPGEDGLSVLRRIRSRDDKLPVMMLTAKGTEYDKVTGLDAGADDYMTKPFGIMELVARVKALLRRTDRPEKTIQNEYQSGKLRINWERHEVRVDGEQINLTYKEYELLHYLIKNEGLALSRETILDAVWGFGVERKNRTLDVHIRTLRAKLKDTGAYIQTIRGLGYKFSGDEQ